MIWLSGWAPHESQQKPLQAGIGEQKPSAAGVRQAVKNEREGVEPLVRCAAHINRSIRCGISGMSAGGIG